jgi:hypothetical protein
LIDIKPRAAPVDQAATILRPRPFRDVDNRVADHPTLRFAVGTFETWERLRNALQDLSFRGLSPDRFNCLALERVLADKALVVPSQRAMVVQKLPFPDDRQLICCTSGPLADCLADRLRAGAPTMEAALRRWLIPRHAARFQDAVEGGSIILWVQLFDNDDERRAYQGLLASSSNSVGVHDLVESTAPSGGTPA